LGLRINELVAARLAAEGFGNVKESHGYVIQHLIDEDRSITELANRMEVSQQAAFEGDRRVAQAWRTRSDRHKGSTRQANSTIQPGLALGKVRSQNTIPDRKTLD
jgi:hypothetical protein